MIFFFQSFSPQSNLLNLTDLGSVYDTVEVELGIVAAPSEERCMMPIRYVMRSIRCCNVSVFQ